MATVIDESTVRHLAHLARLHISDDEIAVMATQLSRILVYMAQLGEVNTDSVEPTFHSLPLKNVLRADRVQTGWDIETTMRNAPDRSDDFFRVPRVLDNRGASS